MKVLVYIIESRHLNQSGETEERIRRIVQKAGAHVTFADNHEEAIQEIEDADILFGDITPEMFKNAKRLKWIQAPISSFGKANGEYYIFHELTQSDIMLTSMSGIYSDVIATHVFAFITSFARDFPKLLRNQTLRVWDRDIKIVSLQGKILGVVGLGGVGKQVARIGAAFGMRVIAAEPNPQNIPLFVEKIWDPGDLKGLLKEADFVVLCIPDAPGTVNLIGVEELKSMKRTAYLINIGRGRTVDLDALTHTLKSGGIAGAGLDVFPPSSEPLPSDHPLWAMENVIITPHRASHGISIERRVDVFLENFDRYVQGKDLLNVVDKKSMVLIGPGYSLPFINT
ncbi:D-2-hydroxyacid dehydrogenase [Chloroflexota bacterium]